MGTEAQLQASADTTLFRDHWQDEADAAFLYGVLANAEHDPERAEIYRKLAKVEERHVEVWARLLEQEAKPAPRFRPSLRAQLLAWSGKVFGTRLLLPMLLAEEGREMRSYLQMHRETPVGVAGRAEAFELARESADHAPSLGQMSGRSGEPWHRIESGGFLRNVVYGFNDGLTANFGLVAGVIGATSSAQQRAVIVAGVAGVIADSLSMGASGYLAAKSEREVFENEIAMERAEIELMPEVERDELALLYEAQGMDRASATARAQELFADPARMLEAHVKEELKIGEQTRSPFNEGWVTGVSTAVGALIPVFPFFVLGSSAPMTAFAISMLSHFVVGAARSVFTGRPLLRSGLDMFVVGIGVALVGYLVGEWISHLL